MIYTAEVKHMCPVAKGAYHGPAPIPEEGKWVQAKEIKDISGFTHGVGWCAPQQGACKLSLNIKNGVIEEALVETIGCSGMTHSAAMAAEILPGLGADAVGLNCSSGPDQIGTVVRMMKKAAPETPIAAKPNAGLPTITETGEAVYHMNPEDFARHMRALKQDGASLLGGCCGTGPAYIEALRALR